MLAHLCSIYFKLAMSLLVYFYLYSWLLMMVMMCVCVWVLSHSAVLDSF